MPPTLDQLDAIKEAPEAAGIEFTDAFHPALRPGRLPAPGLLLLLAAQEHRQVRNVRLRAILRSS